MTKAFRKESIGEVRGSLGPPKSSDLIHSPEEIAKQQALADQISAQVYSQLQQNFYSFIDESTDVQYGDMVSYITYVMNNYINNAVNIIGQMIRAGDGIKLIRAGSASSAVAVRDGKGLDASSGPLHVELTDNKGLKFSADTNAGTLEVKPGAGISVSSVGVNVALDDELDTAESDGSGLSLSAATADGVLRVAPLDFLYTAADV